MQATPDIKVVDLLPLFGLVLAATTLLACSNDVVNNGDPWSFGDDVGVGGAEVAVGPSPDAVNGFDPPCEPRVVIDEGSVTPERTRPIVVHDGTWYFLRANYDGGFSLWQQTSVDAEPTQLRERVLSLVDAGPQGVLFIEEAAVILLDPTTGEERMLSEGASIRDWQRAPFNSAAFRAVGDELVTWVDDGVSIASEDGTSIEPGPVSSLPYARNGRVAWTRATNAAAGGLTIRGDDRSYDFDEANATNVALSESHLWFVRSGSSLYQSARDAWSNGLVEPVAPSEGVTCNSVAVSDDGEDVVAACERDGQPTIYRSNDGVSWEHVADPVGDPNYLFAIDEGWVVYAEWATTPPVLVAVPPGEPDAAFELAEIGTGCLACGAFWAPNYVEIHDGKVAWNYAEPGGEPSRDVRVGMAELCP